MASEIDGKEIQISGILNLDGFTNIEKALVSGAFPSYGEHQMVFNKKGAEVKTALINKLAKAKARKEIIKEKKSILKSELEEKNYKPSCNDYAYAYGSMDEDKGELRFNYDTVREASDEEDKKMMRMYNDMVYSIQSLKRECETIEVLLKEIDEKKTYKFNVAQLMALKKGYTENGELNKAEKDITAAMKHADKPGEGAKKRKHLKGKDKVHIVMKEFQRGTLRSGSGKKVTNRKQAIAIAMSEAGLSKDMDGYDDMVKMVKAQYSPFVRTKDEGLKKGKSKEIKQLNPPQGKFLADKDTDTPEYKEHFAKMLKKEGYDSINKMPANKKKKFFEKVDASWKGKSELNKALSSLGIAPYQHLYQYMPKGATGVIEKVDESIVEKAGEDKSDAVEDFLQKINKKIKSQEL